MSDRVVTIGIFLGLVFGTAVGQMLYDPSFDPEIGLSSHQHAGWLSLFSFIGLTVFMGLLKLLILPLVASSVIVAVTSMESFEELKSVGAITIVYYAVTMLIAVAVGVLLVSIVAPGEGLQDIVTGNGGVQATAGLSSEAVAEASSMGVIGIFENLVSLMIPENIFHALSHGQTLGVIVFSLFFSVTAVALPNNTRWIEEGANAVFAVVMRMVEIVLWLAPLGVFALMALVVAKIGLGVFAGSITTYILTVLGGLAIHGFIILPLLLWIFAKANPFSYFNKVKKALLTALGTDSSSATLPVSIECATVNAGISPRIAGLVLPLGSTINMDGTALYEAVAVIFLAQAYGIELGMTQLILIALTATLAAVGAAGIPSAGLVTMVIVLEATNQSLLAANPAAALVPISAIGLIIGVDRVLDMARTTINVWGDLVGAKIVSRYDKQQVQTT